MSRLAAATLLLLTAACATAPDDCADDASCTEEALKAGSFKLAPASASVATAVGTAPAPAATALTDSTKKGHAFAVSCSGGAVATPASGTVTKAAPVTLSVQAAAPRAAGSSTATCQVSSTSGSSSNAVFTLTVTATGGGGGGGGGIKTVWLILMENHNWSQIKGKASAPYINGTLLPMGSHAEQYFNPPKLHPSEPNYLWLEAGTNFGVLDDNPPSANHQASTQHLATLLEAAGHSWRSYQEGISGTGCPVTASGLYAPKHNPFVFFDDVAGSARCAAHVRPYAELAQDLAADRVADYSFVTPDLCDDMHNSSGCATTDAVKNGDTWLSQAVPPILASAAYQRGGAVFITWDESEGGEFPIGMIVLSPQAKGAGYASSVHTTHSSMLRTAQEIFAVTPLLGDAANATDLSDLFRSFP